MNEAPSILIVGVGNAYRRDDGAGPAIVSRLRSALSADIQMLTNNGDFTSLLDDWQGADMVIVVDATSSGCEPGTITRHDAHEGPLPASLSQSSTHSFGIAEIIELARALDRLPPRLIMFGIEGRDFSPGEGLSPDVDAVLDEAAGLVSEQAGVCADALKDASFRTLKRGTSARAAANAPSSFRSWVRNRRGAKS